MRRGACSLCWLCVVAVVHAEDTLGTIRDGDTVQQAGIAEAGVGQGSPPSTMHLAPSARTDDGTLGMALSSSGLGMAGVAMSPADACTQALESGHTMHTVTACPAIGLALLTKSGARLLLRIHRCSVGADDQPDGATNEIVWEPLQHVTLTQDLGEAAEGPVQIGLGRGRWLTMEGMRPVLGTPVWEQSSGLMGSPSTTVDRVVEILALVTGSAGHLVPTLRDWRERVGLAASVSFGSLSPVCPGQEAQLEQRRALSPQARSRVERTAAARAAVNRATASLAAGIVLHVAGSTMGYVSLAAAANGNVAASTVCNLGGSALHIVGPLMATRAGARSLRTAEELNTHGQLLPRGRWSFFIAGVAAGAANVIFGRIPAGRVEVYREYTDDGLLTVYISVPSVVLFALSDAFFLAGDVYAANQVARAQRLLASGRTGASRVHVSPMVTARGAAGAALLAAF